MGHCGREVRVAEMNIQCIGQSSGSEVGEQPVFPSLLNELLLEIAAQSELRHLGVRSLSVRTDHSLYPEDRTTGTVLIPKKPSMLTSR